LESQVIDTERAPARSFDERCVVVGFTLGSDRPYGPSVPVPAEEKEMRIAFATGALLVLASGIAADTRRVEFDEKIDFSTFKTFVIREGRTSSQKPEINSLTLQKIARPSGRDLSPRR
jgi:hypothetical protein